MVRGEEDCVTEQLDFNWVYNVSPLVTFRMVTRLEHLQEKARHLHQRDYNVLELRERNGLFRAISSRQADDVLPTKGRLFSAKSTLKESQIWQPASWDGSRTFETTLELSSSPVTIQGSGGLVPISSTGTRYTLSMTIDAAGRFSGRKAAAEIAAALGRTIDEEHKFRLIWLERQVPYGI
jgi:hypothetical protein